MIRFVAFDWNGTLLSDVELSILGTNYTAQKLGAKPINKKKYRDYFDVPVWILYEKLGIPQKILEAKHDLIQNSFHAIYEKHEYKLRTRSNTRQILNWLKENNIPTGIFSNHTQDGIEKQTNRLKITHYFTTIIANSLKSGAIKGRNKEEKLKLYLVENSIDPKTVLVVGDSIEEIEISHALGTKSVSITGGYCSKARLIDKKPDYLISNLIQIKEIILNDK